MIVVKGVDELNIETEIRGKLKIANAFYIE